GPWQSGVSRRGADERSAGRGVLRVVCSAAAETARAASRIWRRIPRLTKGNAGAGGYWFATVGYWQFGDWITAAPSFGRGNYRRVAACNLAGEIRGRKV